METSGMQGNAADYAAALKSLRGAKNFFWWLIIIALAVQLVSFVLVQWVGVVDAKYEPTPKVTTQTAKQVAEARSDAAGPAAVWDGLLHWVLPGTKFVAFISALLLVCMLVISLKLSLIGRLGGAAGMIGAVLWSLLLLAMVTPWQQIMDTSVACGALYNLDDLVRGVRGVKSTWGAENVSFVRHMMHLGRFILYPVATMLVWLLTQARFARGYRRIKAYLKAQTPGPVTEQPFSE